MKNKLINFVVKYGSSIMALALIVANFSKDTTCPAIFHQPEVPSSLLED